MTSKIKSIILVKFIIVTITVSGFSQIGGTATYKFLDLTGSAKIAALGGNNISLYVNDLNFVNQNPSLLRNEFDNTLTFNYISYLADINWGYAAYSKNYRKLGNFAAGIQYINYGDFIEADEYGNKTGTFKAAEYALNLIWSKQIDSMFTFGATIKPVYSVLEKYVSFGIAADLGVNYYNSTNDLSVSLVFKNIGTQLKPYTEGNYENIPFDIQLGVSKKLAHAPFRFSITAIHLQKLDLSYEKEEENKNQYIQPELQTEEKKDIMYYADLGFRHIVFGLEFIPMKTFMVNLGYNHQRHQELKTGAKTEFAGVSWGVSLMMKKLTISYGRATYHLAGSSNHITVGVYLNKFLKKNI